MRRSTFLMVVSFVLCAAVSLGAQAPSVLLPADSLRIGSDSAQTSGDVVATAPATAGASMTGLRAGVHARETSRPDRPLVAPMHSKSQSEAMMIVGLAALVAGAIIGGTPGTIIMVGGTVVGLLGLYDYLQ